MPMLGVTVICIFVEDKSYQLRIEEFCAVLLQKKTNSENVRKRT